jgi:hypothetical protein
MTFSHIGDNGRIRVPADLGQKTDSNRYKL